MNDRLSAYFGFAARSRNLQAGYNTCLSLMKRGKVRLLVVAEDSAPNTVEKMTRKCESSGTDYRVFGTKEELSQITGNSGNGVFAVTDRGFAKAISGEIDRIQLEGVKD